MKQNSYSLLIICFITLIVGVLCMEKDKDYFCIHGHWHLYQKNSTENSLTVNYSVVDFIDDSIVVLGRQGTLEGGIEGYYSIEDGYLKFGGECFYEKFNMVVKKNEIILEDKDTKYYLERCDKWCCNKQEEFFHTVNLSIDLPIIKSNFCLGSNKKSLENPIYIGKRKNEEGKDKFVMKLGDKEANISDIPIWNERHLITIPEDINHKAYHVIYGDKYTPIEKISEIVDFYSENQMPKIYLASRNYSYHEYLEICLIEVNLKKYAEKADSIEFLHQFLE